MNNVAQVVYAAIPTITATISGTATGTAIPHPTGKDPKVTIPPIPSPPEFREIWMHTNRTSCIAFWVFFGVFAAGVLGVAVLAMRVQRRARVFHALAGIALTITTMSYLMLATGLGTSPPAWFFRPHDGPGPHLPPGHPAPGHGHHGHHGHRKHGYDYSYGSYGGFDFSELGKGPMHVIDRYHRQWIWARDFAHVFSAPFFILQLGVLSGMAPLAAFVAAGAASASAFAAAIANRFSRHEHFNPKWLAWFIVAILWSGAVFGYLLVSGGIAARHRAPKTRSRYFLLVALSLITCAVYGVFSILGPATQVTSVDVETIVLGITDVAAQLGFVYFLLFTHVHDEEDSTWTFPEWFAQPRLGADGRGTYARVAAEEPTPAEASA